LGVTDFEGPFAVGIGGIALNNLFLSCLIARQVAQYVEDSPRKMHRTIIAATLESGVIYSAFLITIAALQVDLYRARRNEQQARDAIIQYNLLRAWPSIAGTTTSLVIVRVSLGIAFNDLKTEIMTVRGSETVQRQGEGIQEVRGIGETEGSKEHASVETQVLVIGRDIESGPP
ncbi:hypothetical protein VNI00_018461, partial [Paramarasmius palmivorus]